MRHLTRTELKMKNKMYSIFIENTLIGKTELEFGDPPMGVVFGKIDFININSGYDFFKEYCEKNEIEFEFDSEGKFITTRYIPKLKIIDEENTEITSHTRILRSVEKHYPLVEILAVFNRIHELSATQTDIEWALAQLEYYVDGYIRGNEIKVN